VAVEQCRGGACSHPVADGFIMCLCCIDTRAESCVRVVAKRARLMRDAIIEVLEKCFCEERSCETCSVLNKGLT
jgi:hypothetical protein